MRKRLVRSNRRFEFRNSCGRGEVIKAFRDSYEGGPLFEGVFGMSLEDFNAFVKWVRTPAPERKAKRGGRG